MSQLKNLKSYVEARFKKMTTTPTLNGKRQRIEFPESKLVYFIPFLDYGKDLRCVLTNKCFSWILAIREIFFAQKQTLS